MSAVNPWPRIYCPPGVARPACCPPGIAAVAVHPSHAPDVAHLPEDARAEVAGRTWGLCYGGDPIPGQRWARTDAGWWAAVDGFTPQDVLRLERHPRVLRWRQVQGAHLDHWWSVPVILAPAGAAGQGYVSALDRLVGPAGARIAGEDLAPLQETLLAIVNGVELGQTEAQRNDALEQLAIGLLAIGHWVDAPLLYAAGWLSESVLVRIVVAAADGDDEQAHAVSGRGA